MPKNSLFEFDTQLRNKYGDVLCGIDECGRGSWASIIMAAAVILPRDAELPGINDSKKLSAEKREKMYDEIIKVALAYDVASIDAPEIDTKGVTWANRKVMLDAANGATKKFGKPVSLYVIDQAPSFALKPHLMMAKADGTSLSVAAASIIGKVTRDRLMVELSSAYPEYRLDDNKGYINPDHIAAVLKYGRVEGLHRFSWSVKGVNAPVQTSFNMFDE